jgi:hypothetical protein
MAVLLDPSHATCSTNVNMPTRKSIMSTVENSSSFLHTQAANDHESAARFHRNAAEFHDKDNVVEAKSHAKSAMDSCSTAHKKSVSACESSAR